MTNSAKESILTNINEIRSLDYSKLIHEAFPGGKISRTMAYEDVSYKQLVALLDRSLSQIEHLVKSADGSLLPDHFYLPRIDAPNAPSALSIRIGQMKALIGAKQWAQVGKYTAWLVAYQMAYGFWRAPEKEDISIDNPKLREQQAEIERLLEEAKKIKENLEQAAAKVVAFGQDLIKDRKISQDEGTNGNDELNKILSSARWVLADIQRIANESMTDLNSRKEQAIAIVEGLEENKGSLFDALTETEEKKKKVSEIHNELVKLLFVTGDLTVENEARAKAIEEIKLTASQALESLRETQDKAKIELEGTQAVRAELDDFYQNKQKELHTITNALDTVNTQRDQVSEYANKASETFGALSTRSEESKKTLDAIHVRQQEELKFFEAFKQATQTVQLETEAKQKEAQSSLEEAKQSLEYVATRKKELLQTLGLATDSSLSQHFSNRQGKLSNKLKWWTIFVPITAIAAIAWAIVVFVCFGADGPNIYLNLGINVIKTLPAFILLGFVLRQYSRERLVEEEYAFRAVISSTINTYSELLEDKEPTDAAKRKESNERIQMLREVLRQIYAMPRLYSERRPSILRVRSKDLPEVLKQFNEATKGK